jgi:NAD(P)-dependent dehydrogenase (short-subunit alcohol dehydrogenase family)
VATARKVTALDYLSDADNVLKVALDVTSVEQTENAFAKAIEKFGQVDVVVNSKLSFTSSLDIAQFNVQMPDMPFSESWNLPTWKKLDNASKPTSGDLSMSAK